MKSIIKDEPMMVYSVSHSKKNGYSLAVKVIGDTVNVWNLGDNEEIAQSKTSTILTAYTRGLAHVQEEVRRVFAEAEDARESERDTST